MYLVMLDEEKSIIISDVYKIEVNDTHNYIKFMDKQGSIVALFKLDQVKGFHRTNLI